MKKADAEELIVCLWQVYPDRKDGPMGGLLFYNWLEKEHPEALSFRAAGDKWQTVNGWLMKHKLS